MTRRSLVVAVAALSLLSGCSHITLNKAGYEQVKKVAIVSYALNPSIILGTTNSEEARQKTVDANVKIVAEKLAGQGFEIVPVDEMKGGEAYKGIGRDKEEGYFLPAGFRAMAEGRDNDGAVLQPDRAKTLCEKLGVDGVIAVSERWSIQAYAMGFRAKFISPLYVAMYDKSGQKVWSDMAMGESNDGITLAPGGIVADSVENVVANASQSVSASVTKIKGNLAEALKGK
jgi:hypothetical protein